MPNRDHAPATVIPRPRLEPRVCRGCTDVFGAEPFPDWPGLCSSCSDAADARLHGPGC